MDTTTGQLVITRPAGRYRDAARAYLIRVDGKERGAIKAGESVTLDVPAGARDVQARIDWTGSPALTVEVGGGEEISLLVEPAGSAFSGLFQMLKPTSYLRLTLQDPS